MAIEIDLNLDLYKELNLTRTIPALSSLIVEEITRENFIFGTIEFFEYSKIFASQILVPLQNGNLIGSLGAAMVDNNFGSISYNNFGAATSINLPFYVFDFGASQRVDRFQINWWQTNNYVAGTFRIEASTDNFNWNTIVDNLAGTNIIGNVQYIDILDNTEYQFWRMFVYNGFPTNGQFVVITQMIPQLAGTKYDSIESSNDVVFYFDSNGKFNIENLKTTATDLVVRYKEINA